MSYHLIIANEIRGSNHPQKQTLFQLRFNNNKPNNVLFYFSASSKHLQVETMLTTQFRTVSTLQSSTIQRATIKLQQQCWQCDVGNFQIISLWLRLQYVALILFLVWIQLYCLLAVLLRLRFRFSYVLLDFWLCKANVVSIHACDPLFFWRIFCFGSFSLSCCWIFCFYFENCNIYVFL